MMSQHYRDRLADHHHHERRGNLRVTLGLIAGAVMVVVLARCAASLALTGSLL